MKVVTNEELLRAHADPDNAAIMKTVIGKFTKIIKDYELLEQLAMIGLWNALIKYDSSKQTKFTSYLYSSVRWQILTHLKPKQVKMVSLEEIGELKEEFINMESLLDSLSDYEKAILWKRDVENRTLAEISSEYNGCIETTRRHLLKVYEKIKNDHTA